MSLVTTSGPPNSWENPTYFLQFYFLSIPGSQAQGTVWGCFAMEVEEGQEGALPVRSEGTRYFLLSRSGTLALGAFSTITWEERQRVGMKTAESNLVPALLHPPAALPEVDLSGPHKMFPFLFFLVFCLFRAAPVAYGDSQARGPSGATAASLHQSRSDIRSELHLQPTPQLMATPDP